MSEEMKPKPKPGERSITEIITDLAKPIPDSMLETKKQGGQEITYVPWHQATRLLDLYAPGWGFSVDDSRVVEGFTTSRNGKEANRFLSVTVTLSIPTADGVVSRSQTGVEDLLNLSGYGDPYSNAVSMALRRAAAMFGLGRYLYRKENA